MIKYVELSSFVQLNGEKAALTRTSDQRDYVRIRQNKSEIVVRRNEVTGLIDELQVLFSQAI